MILEEITTKDVLSKKYKFIKYEILRNENSPEKLAPEDAEFYRKVEISMPEIMSDIYYKFSYYKSIA